jgi:hypothetical protein
MVTVNLWAVGAFFLALLALYLVFGSTPQWITQKERLIRILFCVGVAIVTGLGTYFGLFSFTTISGLWILALVIAAVISSVHLI